MAHGRTTTGTAMSTDTGITSNTGKIGGGNTGIATITVPITRNFQGCQAGSQRYQGVNPEM